MSFYFRERAEAFRKEYKFVTENGLPKHMCTKVYSKSSYDENDGSHTSRSASVSPALSSRRGSFSDNGSPGPSELNSQYDNEDPGNDSDMYDEERFSDDSDQGTVFSMPN